MIKYGLISETDARCLEKTIDLICMYFVGQQINTTCIGIFDGDTDRGIYEYVTSKQYGSSSASVNSIMQSHNFKCNHTAIDNEKDKPILKPFPECNLIIGNSNEVYNQLEDESQHMIFFDGDHSLIGVISDFFAYSDKIKVGGYAVFHDCGKHIKPFKDFQHGDKENPDAYISVRKALETIGLIWEDGNDLFIDRYAEEWELVFDEADENNEAGGVCVFKKLY